MSNEWSKYIMFAVECAVISIIAASCITLYNSINLRMGAGDGIAKEALVTLSEFETMEETGDLADGSEVRYWVKKFLADGYPFELSVRTTKMSGAMRITSLDQITDRSSEMYVASSGRFRIEVEKDSNVNVIFSETVR